jgi:hypothetical protein
MTETRRSIGDLARDYADSAELAYAIETIPFRFLPRGSPEPAWRRRWMGLSTWARHRELHSANTELSVALEELRTNSEVLAGQAQELRQRFDILAAEFRQSLVGATEKRRTDLVYRFAQLTAMHGASLQGYANALGAQSQYAEAHEAVALARQRARASLRHFREMRQVRVRGFFIGFLVALSAAAVILLLHWRLIASCGSGWLR